MLRRRAFTLIELLVVMVIVLMVSILAIPAAYQAYGERGIQESARLVQASVVAARDRAARTGQPAGIRFLPDPSIPGMASRLMPVGPAPDYSEGLLSSTDIANLPPTFVLPYPCLMVEQSLRDGPGQLVGATSWPKNIRVGDRLRIGDSGPWMTVVGPTDPANPTDEGFIVITQPLIRSDPIKDVAVDYLWLVNGVDDDHNGFIDDGWDGVDNNADGVTDEPVEWEVEKWQHPVPIVASPYTIRRRPAPSSATRSIDLPASVVIDMQDLPPEIAIDATGTAMPSLPYGVPSSIGLKDHGILIHLVERGTSEQEAWVTINTRTGSVESAVGAP